ncbi:MAG TPA: hypothetical protein VFG69_02095 [Nannocystaceae bacterium]|nr:hypothetical protein [Nannocystaceae bacterium]
MTTHPLHGAPRLDRVRLLLAAALALAPACNRGGDEKKADAKDETKADAKDETKADAKADDAGDEETLKVGEGDAPVSGPVPPETSMVFFAVEGSLLPLGCFDKDKKKVLEGEPCLAMVKKDDDVRVASKFSQFGKKAGDRTVPTCMAGDDKKIAIAVEGITEGADFVYGAWPPSAINAITRAPDDTTKPDKVTVGDTEKSKLLGAAGTDGEIIVNQVWEIDLDGDAKADKLYAAYVPNPSNPEAHKWSGLVFAKGGNLEELTVIEAIRSKPDVVEVKGVLDLDGDKKSEIWIRRTSEDGSAGERLYHLGKGDAIGKWTCGAV